MKQKLRNHIANVATFRGSAGPMKDRRAKKGGASNQTRSFLTDYEMEIEDHSSDVVMADNYLTFFEDEELYASNDF